MVRRGKSKKRIRWDGATRLCSGKDDQFADNQAVAHSEVKNDTPTAFQPGLYWSMISRRYSGEYALLGLGGVPQWL